VLFHDGTVHYLADGFHRYLASRRLGLAEILADVRAGTKQDALWFALGANRENAHQMTPQDKRHAILLALREWPEMSNNRIAEQSGCSQSYVQRLKSETTEVPTCGNVQRVTGKDGKSYPASRQRQELRSYPQAQVGVVVQSVDSAAPDYTGRTTAYRAPTAPRIGLQLAQIAIRKLEEIQEDDLERADAFRLMRSWLNERHV
jgi:ParB-like chromosome segregation protein Spo0J